MPQTPRHRARECPRGRVSGACRLQSVALRAHATVPSEPTPALGAASIETHCRLGRVLVARPVPSPRPTLNLDDRGPCYAPRRTPPAPRELRRGRPLNMAADGPNCSRGRSGPDVRSPMRKRCQRMWPPTCAPCRRQPMILARDPGLPAAHPNSGLPPQRRAAQTCCPQNLPDPRLTILVRSPPDGRRRRRRP